MNDQQERVVKLGRLVQVSSVQFVCCERALTSHGIAERVLLARPEVRSHRPPTTLTEIDCVTPGVTWCVTSLPVRHVVQASAPVTWLAGARASTLYRALQKLRSQCNYPQRIPKRDTRLIVVPSVRYAVSLSSRISTMTCFSFYCVFIPSYCMLVLPILVNKRCIYFINLNVGFHFPFSN